MIPDDCKIDSHLLIVSALVSTSLAIALIFNNSPERTANVVKNLINYYFDTCFYGGVLIESDNY